MQECLTFLKRNLLFSKTTVCISSLQKQTALLLLVSGYSIVDFCVSFASRKARWTVIVKIFLNFDASYTKTKLIPKLLAAIFSIFLHVVNRHFLKF